MNFLSSLALKFFHGTYNTEISHSFLWKFAEMFHVKHLFV